MRYKKQHPISSNTSPDNDSRGCLCRDGTYSRECCDGSLIAQGIGSLINGSANQDNVTYDSILVTYNGINVKHTV